MPRVAPSLPELSSAARAVVAGLARASGLPIEDRAAGFLRVLGRWPEARAALDAELDRPGQTERLAGLTPGLEARLRGIPPTDRAQLLRVLAIGSDPLGALALLPAGARPLTDTALAKVGAVSADPIAPPQGGAITLIAKLTRYCSLRCTYCNDWRDGPGQNMGVDTQRRMLENALSDGVYSACKIIWHGGEPAQIGLRRALQFLWLQGRLRRPGQTVSNSVQTNAAFLPKGMIDLWQAFGVSVSVSLDGPRQTHNRTRKTCSGEDSFDAVVEGISQIKAAGVFSGALIVVTPEIAAMPPRQLVEGLISAGVHNAAFLPVRPSARDGRGPYLSPHHFADFLVGLFDTLRLHPELEFDVREIDALYRAYSGRPSGFCELNGPCLGSYFAVNPNGTVMHCDKFLDAEDYALGDLSKQNFAAMARSPRIAALRVADRQQRSRLSECRWFGRCKGWCPHESHIAGLRGDHGKCCGLGPVFDHFEALELAAHRGRPRVTVTNA